MTNSPIVRNIDVSAIREFQQAGSGEAYLVFIDISHPGLQEVIRIVSDNADYYKDGNLYRGFLFDIILMSDNEDVPTARLSVQNVDQRIGAILLDIEEPARLDITVVAASEFDLTREPRLPRNPLLNIYRDEALEGFYWAPSPKTCFTDDAGTIPALEGDTVRSIKDMSVNGSLFVTTINSPGSVRPILALDEGTGRWYLDCPTGTISSYRGFIPVSQTYTGLCAYAHDNTLAGTGYLFENLTNNEGFRLQRHDLDTVRLTIRQTDMSSLLADANGNPDGGIPVLFEIDDTTDFTLKTPGSEPTTAMTIGFDPRADGALTIGGHANASAPFVGRIYGAQVLPRLLTVGERAQAYEYMKELLAQENTLDPVAVIYRAEQLYLNDVQGNDLEVSGNLASWNYSQEPYPGMAATKDRFPGLFR